MYYDRTGQRISMDEYLIALKDKRVALTEIDPDIRVSTVYLGLEHGEGPTGKPLIFETMVFRGDSYADLDMDRYETEEAALAGHEAIVKRWQEKQAI